MTKQDVVKALRYYAYGEGLKPDYSVLRALIGKGYMTSDGRLTNLGYEVAGTEPPNT